MAITIQSIIKRDAQFSRNAGASVVIYRGLGSVSIKWFGEGEALITGDEGFQFIHDLDTLIKEAPDVHVEDINLHLARPYVESL